MSEPIKDLKPFTIAFFKDLEHQYAKEEITYTRMVELLNEKALSYAQHKSEQAYQRGRSEGYNKGYSDGLNAEELKF